MRSLNNRNGFVSAWVCVLILMLVSFVGLATDAALMVLAGQQLQIGADAAALAGVQKVRADIAQGRAAAQNIALQNKVIHSALQLDLNAGNAGGGDIVVGRFNRDTQAFSPQTSAINAILVRARRTGDSLNGPLNLTFMSIFGMPTANIARHAIAMVGGGTGAGMIALDPHKPKALYIKGNATVTVNGGDIQVNSDSTQGAYFQGSFTLDAENLNVVGDYKITGGGDLGDVNPNPGAPYMPDPLGFLPAPAYDPAANLGTVSITNGTRTLQPGYYSGGISATGGTITLQPGIYILNGAGLNIAGNANFTGHGVMFYFVGTGRVAINGTGQVLFRPPDPEHYSFPGVETYEGILFFQARNNTTESTITGTSGLDLEGSLYFPAANVLLNGTTDKLGTQFIANTIEISGDSNLTINYDGRFPAAGNKVFLVQ